MDEFVLIAAIAGALIGGIFTPLIFHKKGRSGWAGFFLGLLIGAIGGLLFLIPFWLIVPKKKEQEHPRPIYYKNNQKRQSQSQALQSQPVLPPIQPIIPTFQETLFLEASAKWKIGKKKDAGILLDQILKTDFLHPGVWKILHDQFGAGRSFHVFQKDFTRQYYPQFEYMLDWIATLPDNIQNPVYRQAVSPPPMAIYTPKQGGKIKKPVTARKVGFWILAGIAGWVLGLVTLALILG